MPLSSDTIHRTAHPVLTIGYGSRRSVAELLGLLKAHGVGFVVDVRSKPYSKFRPEFSQRDLRESVESAGLRYVFLGDVLGGRPSDPSCYTDGHVDYSKCRNTDEFKGGLRRLIEGSSKGHGLVLLCAELEPENCHRSKLIGEALREASVEVLHIDGQGRLKTQAQVVSAVVGPQMGLFGPELKSRKRYGLPEDENG
jgi:uncharacterized protein (DUF488 family)